MTTVRLIQESDKLPKGYKYLTSWKCEELLCNEFEAFKNLEKFTYYILKNKNQYRYLWLPRLDGDSSVVGGSRYLDYDDGVCGVLIWKN